MDFEYFPNLSKEEINKISLAFIKEVERLSGKKPLYTVMHITQVIPLKEKLQNILCGLHNME